MADNIKEILKKEILNDDNEVRAFFVSNFKNEITDIIDGLETACKKWLKYHSKAEGNKRRQFICGFLLDAIDSLAVSMKLFLCGYAVPSGYLMRRTIESVAMAILCSSDRLPYFERIDEEKFSPNKAVNCLQRNANKLSVNNESVAVLKKFYKYYHQYSHSSLLSLAHLRSFSENGVYIGGRFDKEKMDGYHGYRREVKTRVSAARVLSNILDGIVMIEKQNR